MSRQDAEMRLAAYVPMLLDRFPDEAFTTASLQYVAARAVKGFPTYGELAEWLSDWWRDNRPRPIAIVAPATPATPEIPPPTPEQIERVHGLVREFAGALHGASLYAEPPRRPHPRVLSPAQLAEAYRHANINAPARSATAAPDASAAPIDPDAADPATEDDAAA
jgi:hypothetical protein